MNKKASVVDNILGNIGGLIMAAALILFIIGAYEFMVSPFLNPAYASSKSNFERIHETVKVLKEGQTRSLVLDLEKGTWLFGFNKNQHFVEYRRKVYGVVQRTLEQSKPRSCPEDQACLCLCTDDCKKFSNCKILEDIDFIVATDISTDLNGGTNYEYDGDHGNYLAMPGKGIQHYEIWREDDTLYFGTQRPGKDQARQEFEEFIEFTKKIGTLYPGTCKLVFEINTTKLTQEYHIMVYYDEGEAKLFAGQGEQERNIETAAIEPTPILFVDFDDIDEVFEDYDNLPRTNFIIPHTILPSIPDRTGLGKSVRSDRAVLLQRAGYWLWTKHEPKNLEICEQ